MPGEVLRSGGYFLQPGLVLGLCTHVHPVLDDGGHHIGTGESICAALWNGGSRAVDLVVGQYASGCTPLIHDVGGG